VGAFAECPEDEIHRLCENHPKRLRLGPVIDSGDDPTAPAPSIPFRLAPIVCESLPGWVDSVKTDLKRRRDPNADALFDLEADIPTNVHRFTRRLQRTACQLFQFAVQEDATCVTFDLPWDNNPCVCTARASY